MVDNTIQKYQLPLFVHSLCQWAMFPSTWNSSKRKVSAEYPKKDTVERKKRYKRTIVPESSEQVQHLMQSLIDDKSKDEGHDCQSTPESDVIHDSVSMMSFLPISEEVQSFTSDKGQCIPIVTRVYEERYMRECKSSSEKKCIMGTHCECMFLDSKNQFVGVKFEIPDVMNASEGMCVMCLRKTTSILFYKTICEGLNPRKVIQKYGNICNTENEYHPSVMLRCPVNGPLSCMPIPIVAHQRNRYSVVVQGGLKFIKQSGVYMEDFA